MAENSLLRNVRIAVRFIVFGVFGFVVMFFAFVMLLGQLTFVHHADRYLVPLGLIVVSGLGAVMMLFGVGEWGRWGYLFVFLSFPVSLLLLFLFPHAGKDAGGIVPTLASVGTYIVVRTYYARRKGRNLLPSLIKRKDSYLNSRKTVHLPGQPFAMGC
jgi:hypothetical protein